MAKTACILAAVTILLLSYGAKAQESKAPLPPYSGVTPEGGEPPVPKPPPEGFQYITWPGFRVLGNGEGGSEVFLQLTGPVTYKVKRRGTRVLITIDNVMVHVKNSLRTVITKHFPFTPVSHFKVRPGKKGKMILDIQLKEPSKPSIMLGSTPGHPYHYLVVTFRPTR